jgi:dienelactone hydrolase
MSWQIYQVTGPVERFAGNIASQGYVVACPSSFHEFEGPEAIPYDTEGKECLYFSWQRPITKTERELYMGAGTDRGNKYKVRGRKFARYCVRRLILKQGFHT